MMVKNSLCRFSMALSAISALILPTGCHHKDLLYEEPDDRKVIVVFDWRDAPDADPASMVAYLYRADGLDYYRYILPGRDGGEIKIPAGAYTAIGLNSDNIDWAQYRGEDDTESIEILTRDATELAVSRLRTLQLPRAKEAENERLAEAPGMLWSARADNVALPDEPGVTYVTLRPREAVCHYSVDVLNVSNIQSLDGSQTDATLSGMAEGFFDGKQQASDQKVTMPFLLTADRSSSSLHADFLTFGECPDSRYPHHITFYVCLTDGSKRYYSVDVSSQVSDAPDPRHVHIVINGLELPREGTQGGGGLIPTVDDWNETDINIDMGT